MCEGVCEEQALALGWEPCEEEVKEVAPVMPECLPLGWAAALSDSSLSRGGSCIGGARGSLAGRVIRSSWVLAFIADSGVGEGVFG